MGTRLESLTLEAFQACLQKNNDYESGITKCFLGFYVSKKRAILFYFLQPASIQLLVFASGASVPTGSAENFPLCCPLHEKVPRVSYTVILKSPLLCPLSNEHKKRWRKFRCHENCLTLQMLDLRRPSYFPLRRQHFWSLILDHLSRISRDFHSVQFLKFFGPSRNSEVEGELSLQSIFLSCQAGPITVVSVVKRITLVKSTSLYD